MKDPAPSAPAEVGEPVRLKIVVVSPYPTEVLFDLRPVATNRRIVAQPLRAVDPSKPRLSEVTIEESGADEPVTLRIRVPVGHPGGVYNGLIIDEETNRPLGTVSLRVGRE